MKLVRDVSCLFSLLLAMGGLGGFAWAQEEKTNQYKTGEVTVTATKIEKDIDQVTDAVTVIDEESIKDSALTDLSDILRFTPGIGFKRVGGPGQYVYTKMRGFSDGHFAVIIDGMKINEGMSAGTGNLFSKLDPFLIERVEVLRGPQSALYGSDTTAGVMSFTTKGGLPGSKVTVGGEYGTYQWKKGYASIRGIHEGLRYSINGIYVDSDGVHEYENFRNFSPQVKLGWNYKDVFDAELSYLHIDSKWNYAKLIENYNHVESRSQWYGFQVPDPERWNKEYYDLATLNLKHKLSKTLRQKLMLGWYKKKTESNNPNNGLLGYITAPQDNFTLDWTNYYNKGDRVPVYDDGDGVPYYFENQNYQADYNLIWDQYFGAGKNTILLGLEWLTQKGKKWGKYGGGRETGDQKRLS